MEPTQGERLLRAFLDFASAVQHLKGIIGEVGSSQDQTDAAVLGPLALETLCLWCRRAPFSLRQKRALTDFDEASSNGEEIDVANNPPEAIAIKTADVLNNVLMTNPTVYSPKLLAAGAVPALVHSTAALSGFLQASACCCLQNLCAVDETSRHYIMEGGGLNPVIDLARNATYLPAATAACGVLQNVAMIPKYEAALVDSGCVKVLLNRCRSTKNEAEGGVSLVESAARALKNLASGTDAARLEISRLQGIAVLSELLKIAKVAHPKNGVIELRMPSKLTIVGAAGALRGLSMVNPPPIWSDTHLDSLCRDTMGDCVLIGAL